MIWQYVFNDMVEYHANQHLLVVLSNLNVWEEIYKANRANGALTSVNLFHINSTLQFLNVYSFAWISFISGSSWSIPFSVLLRTYSAAIKVYGSGCFFLFARTLQNSRTVKKYMISTTLRRLKPRYNPRIPPQLAANMNRCMRGS